MKKTLLTLLLSFECSLVMGQSLSRSEPSSGMPSKKTSNPSLQAVMQAVETKNVAAIVQACSRFTHSVPLFRAQVIEMSRRITAANAGILKAQQVKQQIIPEVARLRYNAGVSERSKPLHPDDTSNQTRAQEARTRANALEADAQKMIEEAQKTFDTNLKALGKLVDRICEADAEDTRRKIEAREEAIEEAEARTADAASKLMELKKQEEITQMTEAKQKVIKAFMASISEPEGRAPFASKNVKPSYDETLAFINSKLVQNDWILRFGTHSNTFILIHPEGVYYLDFSSLNPRIKYTTKDNFFSIQLEIARPDVTIRAISSADGSEEKVRKIAVPCDDKIDSERLAAAFRHLILMAGGKDDPF